MKTLLTAAAVVFALSFAVTARADDYGRCHDRAVKSCNAFEDGRGVEDTRNGGGSHAQSAEQHSVKK